MKDVKIKSPNLLASILTIIVGFGILVFGGVINTDDLMTIDGSLLGLINTAGILNSGTADQLFDNSSYTAPDHLSVHENEYWGFRFYFDPEHYQALEKSEVGVEQTLQDFIDDEIEFAKAVNNRADRSLTDDDVARANTRAAEVYRQYQERLQTERLATTRTTYSDTDPDSRFISYKVVPKNNPVLAHEVISSGVITDTVELVSDNLYYNRYGERQNRVVVPIGVTAKYDWFYDNDLGTVVIAWCDMDECDSGYQLENTYELFPQQSNSNGYYVYVDPIRNRTNHKISECVNLPNALICFGGTDLAAIKTAVQSVQPTTEG